MTTTNNTTIDNAYQQGVADEYRRLTQWHSPDVELPEYDKTILIKFDRTNLLFDTSKNVICTGHLNKALTTIKGRPFWCIDDGTTDRLVVTGWRYIYEYQN